MRSSCPQYTAALESGENTIVQMNSLQMRCYLTLSLPKVTLPEVGSSLFANIAFSPKKLWISMFAQAL